MNTFSKAFSLIEVLVAVSLITTIIVTILQMQQNNIYFLEKFKTSSLDTGYISFVISDSKDIRNKNIIVSDVVNFNDDDIRKELKDIKIKIKDERIKDIELPKNDYINNAKVIKSTYILDDKQKTFYSFTIE